MIGTHDRNEWSRADHWSTYNQKERAHWWVMVDVENMFELNILICNILTEKWLA